MVAETQSKGCFLVQDTIYIDSVYPSEPLQRNITGQILWQKMSMKSSKIKKKNPPPKILLQKARTHTYQNSSSALKINKIKIPASSAVGKSSPLEFNVFFLSTSFWPRCLDSPSWNKTKSKHYLNITTEVGVVVLFWMIGLFLKYTKSRYILKLCLTYW